MRNSKEDMSSNSKGYRETKNKNSKNSSKREETRKEVEQEGDDFFKKKEIY